MVAIRMRHAVSTPWTAGSHLLRLGEISCNLLQGETPKGCLSTQVTHRRQRLDTSRATGLPDAVVCWMCRLDPDSLTSSSPQ